MTVRSDDFNRADANPIGGNWTTLGSNAMKIVTNRATGATGSECAAYWNADTFGNDQFSQAKIITLGSTHLYVRANTGPTFYMARFNSTTVAQLYKFTGSYTKLGTDIAGTYASGDTLKVSISSGTLTIYQNGSALTTRDDATYASGKVCIAAIQNNYLDDWTGGDVTAAATYTLAADKATYTLTGKDCAFLTSRVINADKGEFTLTGKDAGLAANRILGADKADFTLTGKDVSFGVSRALLADKGTFVLTGKDVDLAYTPISFYSVTVDSGVFNLTGKDASLIASRILSTDEGEFTVSGKDINLTYTPVSIFTMTADPGVFTLTGKDVMLPVSRALIAEKGTYDLTGKAVSLTAARQMAAELTSFILTGKDVSFITGKSLVTDKGIYTLSGKDITYSISRRISVDIGSFSINGRDINLIYSGADVTADIIEKKIFSLLSNSTTITAHLNVRIYPMILPQRATLPAVTYERTYDAPENGRSGYLSEHNPHIDISAWSRTYAEAKELKEHIHAAMDGATSFKSVLVSCYDSIDTRENNTIIYGVKSEYSCWKKFSLS